MIEGSYEHRCTKIPFHPLARLYRRAFTLAIIKRTIFKYRLDDPTMNSFYSMHGQDDLSLSFSLIRKKEQAFAECERIILARTRVTCWLRLINARPFCWFFHAEKKRFADAREIAICGRNEELFDVALTRWRLPVQAGELFRRFND